MQFCGGGASYGLLEIMWRGYTHISMLIAGGICFWLLVRITKIDRGLFIKSVIGGLCITFVEFISGCIVNLWLDLSVWDYSSNAMSFLGQVCLGYTILWMALSAIVIQICRFGLDFRKHITNTRFLRYREILHRDTQSLSASATAEHSRYMNR